MKFGKAMKLVKQAQSLPTSVKKAYNESPQRQAIELKVTQRGVTYVYKPIIKAVQNMVSGKYNSKDAKRLKKWSKKFLKNGTGYSKQTKRELKRLWPEIAGRARTKQLTEEDKAYLANEVLPWVKAQKRGEEIKVLKQRHILEE